MYSFELMQAAFFSLDVSTIRNMLKWTASPVMSTLLNYSWNLRYLIQERSQIIQFSKFYQTHAQSLSNLRHIQVDFPL